MIHASLSKVNDWPARSPCPMKRTFCSGSRRLLREVAKPDFTKFSILNPEMKTQMMKKVTNTGFTINNISIQGPAIILNKQLLMWDVPQFGVGGPKGDVDPIEKGKI